MKALSEFAGSQDGANEEPLALGHGFSCRMLAALLRGGLAAAQREVVKAGGKPIEVSWIRITAAGRQTIEGRTARNNDVGINHRYFPNSRPSGNGKYRNKRATRRLRRCGPGAG
jgi:hypothetical protein